MFSNLINLCVCNQSSDKKSSIKVNESTTTIQPENIKVPFYNTIKSMEKMENNFKYNNNSTSNSPSNNERTQITIRPSKFSNTVSPIIANGILNRNTLDKNFINEKIKKKCGTCKSNMNDKFINEKVVFKNFHDKVDLIIQEFLIKRTVSESEDSELIEM